MPQNEWDAWFATTECGKVARHAPKWTQASFPITQLPIPSSANVVTDSINTDWQSMLS